MKGLTKALVQGLPLYPKQEALCHPSSGRAAVAILVREDIDATKLLMIRRAIREGDPWSGHMGFPGGRREPSDKSNLCCAVRETSEELGLDLEQWGILLGKLSEVNTGWRSDRPEILVTPFVFQVKELPPLKPNQEVDDFVWVPLGFLMDPDNREPMEWEWKGQKMVTASYLYENNRIWGLSLIMIDELMQIIGD